MLISLIFGSNHKTVLDLAYEILAWLIFSIFEMIIQKNLIDHFSTTK